jgi:hypothetical protein
MTSFGPSEWATICGEALTEFKAIRDELPQGKLRDDVAERIKRVESTLARADAELAQKLGYDLCQCAFPATPMLWRQAESTTVCPKCSYRTPIRSAVKVATNRHDRREARRAGSDDWDVFTGK